MMKQKTPEMKARALRNGEKHRSTFIIAKITSNLKKYAAKKKNADIDFDGLADISPAPYPDSLPSDNVEAAIYLMQKS